MASEVEVRGTTAPPPSPGVTEATGDSSRLLLEVLETLFLPSVLLRGTPGEDPNGIMPDRGKPLYQPSSTVSLRGMPDAFTGVVACAAAAAAASMTSPPPPFLPLPLEPGRGFVAAAAEELENMSRPDSARATAARRSPIKLCSSSAAPLHASSAAGRCTPPAKAAKRRRCDRYRLGAGSTSVASRRDRRSHLWRRPWCEITASSTHEGSCMCALRMASTASCSVVGLSDPDSAVSLNFSSTSRKASSRPATTLRAYVSLPPKCWLANCMRGSRWPSKALRSSAGVSCSAACISFSSAAAGNSDTLTWWRAPVAGPPTAGGGLPSSAAASSSSSCCCHSRTSAVCSLTASSSRVTRFWGRRERATASWLFHCNRASAGESRQPTSSSITQSSGCK
mmetsp:Transcript_17479/g.48600  ORF Transcript_17479/g.48600 Transcript_17479/m.48600 type:complete len:395 (+) Transcript_17479:5313-6497(+)